MTPGQGGPGAPLSSEQRFPREEGAAPGERVFDLVRSTFDRLARIRPDDAFDSYYSFGGHAVHVSVVGRSLAEITTRPFAHLKVQPDAIGPADLTIHLWDENETSVRYPEEIPDVPLDGTWKVGGGVAAAFDGGRFFRYQERHSITWLDRGTRQIVGWRASGSLVPIHERAKPLPLLLAIWYNDRNTCVTHAGLIANNGQAVLVGGGTGSGKTTVCLATVLRGPFDYLSDDHTGLQSSSDGSFLGHSLYNSARVTPDHLARLPELRPLTISSHDPKEKGLVFLFEAMPERVRRVAPIRAIVLPRMCGSAHTLVRQASKREALLRLAPTSVYTAFGPGMRGLSQLSQLVQRVPGYWLDLSEALEDIPLRLEDILTAGTTR